jgi:outer membrane receptor protein involved in Fe transport
VFGEANWKVMPRVTVTGGLRYTYQKEVRRLHELRVWRP